MIAPQSSARAPSRDGARVARNAFFLVGGQVATAAISIGLTAVLARHLGAQDYGVFYLAATLVQSAFVLADFGQEYYVVGQIAKQASAAGTLLGTGLLLRFAGAIAAFPVLAGVAAVLEYPETTRAAISLTIVFFLLNSITNGINVVLRGLERMGLEATLRVASKLLVALAIGIAVIGNGHLTAVLIAQIGGAGVAVLAYWLAARSSGMPRPRVSLPTTVSILSGGAPFWLAAMAIAAQSSIDALLLSVLAPPDTIGWHGAAWKLVGMLTFPANVLAAALYPTLSRLSGSTRYGDLLRDALRATILLGVLSAAGTYLFAETAIAWIYGAGVFGPAAGNLEILAPYVLLGFVDIVLGAAIMAAASLTPWILAKLASVLVAAGVSVVLIPIAQASLGNGGLGCATGTVAAELVMFGATLFLVPADRARLAVTLLRTLGSGAIAAIAMGIVTWLLRDADALASMAIAVATYFVSVCLLGGVRREDVRFVRDVIRFRSPA